MWYGWIFAGVLLVALFAMIVLWHKAKLECEEERSNGRAERRSANFATSIRDLAGNYVLLMRRFCNFIFIDCCHDGAPNDQVLASQNALARVFRDHCQVRFGAPGVYNARINDEDVVSHGGPPRDGESGLLFKIYFGKSSGRPESVAMIWITARVKGGTIRWTEVQELAEYEVFGSKSVGELTDLIAGSYGYRFH